MSNRPASSPTDAPAPAAPDLTLSKVLAGAGAAVTAAVLGSFFGTAGTITGAALGSVASTIATVVYQRSLDRTQHTIAARLHPPRDPAGEDLGRSDAAEDGLPEVTAAAEATGAAELTGAAEGTGAVAASAAPGPGAADTHAGARVVPAPRLPVDERVVQRPPPAPAPRARRWGVWLGATALVFVVGLLAVTGIEWVKGSTLSTGQPGTSVGRVLEPASGTDTTTEPTTDPPSSDSTADPDSTANPRSHRSSTPDASATSQPSAASPTSGAAPTSSGVDPSSSPATAVPAVPTTAVSRGR